LKSEEIEPVDFEAARKFSESHMNRSDFLQEFEPLAPSAEARKAGKKKYISVYLPESVIQAATVKAHSEGTSLSVLVEKLLLECIEKDGQK
jgi:predicted HicB family RNase H-like nuclease